MSDVYHVVEAGRLLGYGESDTSGKWIKFELTQDQSESDPLDKFRGLKGQCFDLVIDPSENQETRKPKKVKGEYGKFAQALKLSSFFRTPQVWEKLGTDKEFREWIQQQKSCISGNYSEVVNGEGRCIAAHVRRSNNSGVAHKPEYACVPLTDPEHQLQHATGEAHCLYSFLPEKQKEPFSEQEAKAWFDKQRIKYVSQWAWERAKFYMGIDSMSQVPPENIWIWAKTNDIEKYLPREIFS